MFCAVQQGDAVEPARPVVEAHRDHNHPNARQPGPPAPATSFRFLPPRPYQTPPPQEPPASAAARTALPGAGVFVRLPGRRSPRAG